MYCIFLYVEASGKNDMANINLNCWSYCSSRKIDNGKQKINIFLLGSLLAERAKKKKNANMTNDVRFIN